MVEFEPLPEGVSTPKVQASSVVAATRPPDVVRHARGFVRLLYCQNPFYVISAALVLWGLWLSFASEAGAVRSDELMAGLAGYTILLAAAAVFLIRAGGVWQDVRTILLLVVLLFLATSVSFDETLTAHPRDGIFHIVGGLLFSIGLSEVVLWAIRLRMPAGFRLPYYLLLALMFLYPLGLSRIADRAGDPLLMWALFGFSAAAGLVFLTLLPAVRRGAEYVRDNGSPWPWPLYPWSLFVILGLGVIGRAVFVCLSFYPAGGNETIFGPWFLVPLLMAWCLLLLESGIVARSTVVMSLALAAPVGLVALAATGPAATADDLGFLTLFLKTVHASPLFVTLVAVAVYYLVAMLRRVPLAGGALTAALAALAVCGPQTVDMDSLVRPQGVPILLIAALEGIQATRHRSSFRCLLAVACLAVGAALELPVRVPSDYRELLLAHAALGAVLAVGAAFDDAFAHWLRRVGAGLMLVAGLAAVIVPPDRLGHLPPPLLGAYPIVLAAVAMVYGYLVGPKWHYRMSAVGILGGWAAVAGTRGYLAWRQVLLGMDQIALGTLFFLLALAISLLKTGMPQRWLARWRRQE